MKIDRTILKKLWNCEKVLCPKCNKDFLVPLHKNDDNDFKCPHCNEIFRTINILNNMLKENK